VAALRRDLGQAEKLSGQPRKDALMRLGMRLESDAPAAADQAKVKVLAETVRDLAKGS
jgi:hypothetical protein